MKLNHKGDKLPFIHDTKSISNEYEFISDDEESKQSPVNEKSTAGIKVESTMQTEHEYFEPDVKIEMPAAENDDSDISDVEGGFESATEQCYLCPISSCTFSHSLKDGMKHQDQERAHFMTSHADVKNIDNLHFIKI